MKLTLFIDTLQTGGTQRQIVALARGLASRGNDVQLLTVFPGGRFWEEANSCGAFRTLSLYRRRSGSKASRVLSFFSVPARLRRWLRNNSTDVLYSMLDVANLSACLALLGVRQRPLLVWGIRASACQSGLRARIVQRLSGWFSHGVPLTIANSARGLQAHEEMGFRFSRSAVVHNGFDTSAFQFDQDSRDKTRSAWGAAEDDIVVGLVGRVDPMKGHDHFIAAAESLLPSEHRFRFVCVVPDPAEARGRLERLTDLHRIGDRLLIVDGGRKMNATYSAIDVLVSASNAEGFPNVVGEAMACGRACVVTDVGDAAILVGDCGLLVPAGDAAALAAAIAEAVIDRHKRGTCGKSRIASEFSIETMVEKSRKTIEDALAS